MGFGPRASVGGAAPSWLAPLLLGLREAEHPYGRAWVSTLAHLRETDKGGRGTVPFKDKPLVTCFYQPGSMSPNAIILQACERVNPLIASQASRVGLTLKD